MAVEHDVLYVQKRLDEVGLAHLQCAKRGNSISVFSVDDLGRCNRCRFTLIGKNQYLLDMANRYGKWEPTFFEGTIRELINLVVEQFPWTFE